MSERQLICTPSFDKQLDSLSGKHPDIYAKVTERLRECCKNGPARSGHKLRRTGGLPVFKERLAVGTAGKRGGARLIYYCDREKVVALFIFVKAARADVPSKEVQIALKAANLTPVQESESGRG